MVYLPEPLEKMTAHIPRPELFEQIFADYPAGVMVLDIHTVLVYYNKMQGLIDDLNPAQAMGKTILELYRVTDNSSFPTLRCLFSRQPLINHACYYYTHLGKLINSIHNVFPIMQGGELTGCVCFVEEYSNISGQFSSAFEHLNHSPSAPINCGSKESKSQPYTFDQIVTRAPEMLKALEIASMAADSPSPVMIHAETGCGKEMMAQSIHNFSRRRHKPFVALNCAAIPESLLEGILFGTAKGAFTGALDKSGLFEQADGGTIFLDEINSMPMGLQSKILRAIQEGKVRRVGGAQEKEVSLKVISATSVRPRKAVRDGALRADLFFRLGVVMVNLPPLRERASDILLLTHHFINKLNQSLGKKIKRLTPDMENSFLRYQWPGNVRELEHALEGAMNLARPSDEVLEQKHFGASLAGDFIEAPSNPWLEPTDQPASYFEPVSLVPPFQLHTSVALRRPEHLGADDELTRLAQALEDSGGNAAKAARALGISPQLMQYKIKKYGLREKMKVRFN